jgi:DNA polymerase
MTIYHIDYETASACDITLGSYRYANDPSTRILMFAIAKNDEDPVLWSVADQNPTAREMLREAIQSDAPIYAHNAQFELAISTYRMLADIGIEPPHIDQWRCTLAMCRRAAAPESLAEAAKFFRLNTPKDPRGKALIGIFSDLSKPTTLISPTGEKQAVNAPAELLASHGDWSVQLKGAGVTMTVREAWDLFCEYCKQDVRVEQRLHEKIKHFELKGDVLKSFQFDLRMNWRGVPVNLTALRHADRTVNELKERLSERFTAVTGLQPSQRNAVLAWLKARGYQESDLQSGTVSRVLSDPPASMTPEAVKALRLRDLLSFAALAKIPTMINAACDDGYVRGTMQWHAARTGRAGGRIIQPQNFRKSTIGDETKLCYKMLCEGWDANWYEELWESPLEAIASSIRHFIQRPDGGKFFDADYSSVENKLAAWVVGDTEELEKISNGMDMYKDMAAKMFGVPYDQVTKEQRTIAKPVVLGCGYGVGARSLRDTLEKLYRVKRTRAECKDYVNIYRETHQCTVNAWRELEEAAKAAVTRPGKTFPALENKVAFCVGSAAGIPYLTFRLPSGRRMYYPYPEVKSKFRAYDEEEMEEEPWKREERGYWVEELSFYGRITGKAAWGRIGTFGSRLLENLCQAMGADLLDYGCQQAEEEGFNVCMIIHDQILAFENGRPVSELVEAFCRLQPWAETFPQAASGDIADFYTKD